MITSVTIFFTKGDLKDVPCGGFGITGNGDLVLHDGSYDEIGIAAFSSGTWEFVYANKSE